MFELQLHEADYPESLRVIDKPPERLWGLGSCSVLHKTPAIAIVGSREATPYGRQVAYDLAKTVAAKGVVIVSGLAYGIDTAAHEGTLAAGGITIAVLGCGINYPYPQENLPLKARIAETGLVISEFPEKTVPATWTFPQRNRIISGLAAAVVVVEAGAKSGALVTAQWALSQGKDVYAVPGNITSPQSVGPNRLIQNGATPLLTAEDLLGQLKLPLQGGKAAQPEEISGEEARVLKSLFDGSGSIDEIVMQTGMSASEVSVLLVTLEIQGKVVSLPGGRYKNG